VKGERTLRARIARRAVAAAAALVVGAPLPALGAQCDTLPTPIVYVAGPDSLITVLRGVGAALYGQITIVYKGYPACLGIDNVVNSNKTTPDPAEPNDHSATYWPGVGLPDGTCDLPADAMTGEEVVPDVAISDVFASTCKSYPNGLSGVTDFQGPVMSFGFTVPPASKAKSISREAAYLVWGFGADADHQVSPWTDPMSLYHRDKNSGTENLFAKVIGLDVTKFKGQSFNSTGLITTAIETASAADADKILGMLNVNILDENRSKLRKLAYQHSEQPCGYFPDSDEGSFDKRNVRDGHYPLWAPIHLYAVAENGEPVSPSVKKFIHLILGTEQIDGVDPIQLEATPPSHLIPQCAMRVIRTEDGGALASFAPPSPCGCYFESLTGTTSTDGTCQPCTTSDTCPSEAPRCSYGFCEP
jgi:hypothetical protein